jgi:hypothetical protein
MVQGYGERVIAASPPPPPPLLAPPAIEQPAPHEASYGLVTGTAPLGAKRVVVRIGAAVLADRPLRGRHFTLRVELPPGESRLRVIAVGPGGRRGVRTVGPVLGLPSAAQPRFRLAVADEWLGAAVRRLARGFGGTTGVFVQSLTTGRGAAWNAAARFPAASTLKLAIAAAVLARHEGIPSPDSWVGSELRRLLTWSDDEAANRLEVWLAGSTSAGGSTVTSLLHSLGLTDSEMYGGYLIDRRPTATIPRRVDDPPSFGVGKYTSAADLSGLARAVWLASGNLGPLRARSPGFTAADGRHLLYLLGRVQDPGKLGRRVESVPGVTVLHKAGWISSARHDAGLVFWRGGVLVAAVMTWAPQGAGLTSDQLAGDVAWLALQRFRE